MNVGGRAGHSALHALDVHEGALTDPGGRRWEVEVLSPRDAREEVQDRREAERDTRAQKKLEKQREKVIQALGKYPSGETKTVLRTTAGLHSTAFNQALGDLLTTGEAVLTDVFKSGKKTPLEGYCLAETN
jgi:hypothetical protein